MKEYVTLVFDETFGNYSYKGAPYSSSLEMEILGMFLAIDVGCYWPTFRAWALANKNDPESCFTYSFGGDSTELEEKGNYIFLADEHSIEKKPTKLKIPRDQFVQLLDDWKEKVCEKKPKEVVIKHENDQFIIETKG